MNKKGVQLTLETILLIVLAVMAVVILSTFFLRTSGDFFKKIEDYSGKSNVDDIIVQCNTFVEMNSRYAFCCEKREVRYYEENSKNLIKKEFSCSDLIGKDSILSESLKEDINSLDCEGIC